MKKNRRFARAILVAAAGMVLLVLVAAWPGDPTAPQLYGVTFSQPHATGIGLDWREVYRAILEDLDVPYLRLNVYWDIVEPVDNKFDFSTMDYQLDLAAAREAQVILAIGRKLPRWPECHVPQWAVGLSENAQQEKVLEMVEVVVKRYQDHPALLMWQLENEPLLDFGVCPPEDQKFLQQEERLVRQLDSSHPILITDSGELNSWLPAAAYGDVLGTTMYRTVFSARTNRNWHYDYIFPAWLYRLKARYVGLLRGKQVIISELQGEPWGAKPFTQMSGAERQAAFSPERFRQLHSFARRTQLPVAYWWGVEYWYWEKEVKGNNAYWEYAKSIFTASQNAKGKNQKSGIIKLI